MSSASRWPPRDADGNFSEAWEEHEAPGYDAALDLDYPIQTSDLRWHQRRAGEQDCLAEGRQRNGLVPEGRYPVEILPDGIEALKTQRTLGVSFCVAVLAGPHAGTVCRLRFLFDGPDAIVARDLILHQWTMGLGLSGHAVDPLDVALRLGRPGEGRQVILSLDRRRQQNGGLEMVALDVEVGGVRHA